MKIATSALLFATAISAVSAKDTPLRRARNLQEVDAADAIEADGRRSGSGSAFNGELGTLTSLKGDCIYDFDDEDDFQVLSGSPAAMTCVGTRCNPELGTNNVVGLELEEIKDDKILIGKFNVNCPSKFAEFGVSCPDGYRVEGLFFGVIDPGFLFVDCSSQIDIDAGNVVPAENYCIIKKKSFTFDVRKKFLYVCKEIDN